MASFLTGAHPVKTHGKDISAGVSLDQEAAASAGVQDPLRLAGVGLRRKRQAGDCDSGYSCAYSSNISWRTPNSPLTKETIRGRSSIGYSARRRRRTIPKRSIASSSGACWIS